MIFFDVDTQRDFIDADGALAVPEAGAIKPNLERLLLAAERFKLTTISSRCAHEPDDTEFEIFPPHCLEGTPGAERVFADLPRLPRMEISVDADADPNARLAPGAHYVVKKQAFDLFTNRWLDGLRRGGAFSDQTCVVFGVATDYCVRACALGLAEASGRVLIVEDAMRGVSEETTARALAEMRDAQVQFVSTEEALRQLEGMR